MKTSYIYLVATACVLQVLAGCQWIEANIYLPPTFSNIAIYNTKDLAQLPCDHDGLRFFFPVEFNQDGTYRFPEQESDLQEEIIKRKATEIYVVIHGWDKPPYTAEMDYRDFICRLLPNETREEHAKRVVVGVFWPSILGPNLPKFIPQFSYWAIKSRADVLSLTGFKILLQSVGESMAKLSSFPHYHPYSLHIVGHSFGGRIALNTIRTLYETYDLNKEIEQCEREGQAIEWGNQPEYRKQLAERERTMHLLQFVSLDIVLLNAAVSDDVIEDLQKPLRNYAAALHDHIVQAFSKTQSSSSNTVKPFEQTVLRCLQTLEQMEVDPYIRIMNDKNHVRVYNVFSSDDWATRWLYPLASLFTEKDKFECALGACAATPYPIEHADDAGKVDIRDRSDQGVWNINASKVIKSHGDIYKGRVASLVQQLFAHSKYLHSNTSPSK